MNNPQIVLLAILIVNLLTLAIYGIDKWLAIKQKRRVPEKYLILLAVIGGSVGAWSGMLMFHHKTKKYLFSIGVPVIFVLQVVGVFFALKYL